MSSNHPIEHEEIMAYLDGELTPERAEETASHLEHCPHCKQLAADLRDVSQLMSTWQVEDLEIEPAEELAKAVETLAPRKAALDERRSWLSLLNPRRWPKPVWALAGAVLPTLLIVGLILSRPGSPGSGVDMGTWPSQESLRYVPENRLQTKAYSYDGQPAPNPPSSNATPQPGTGVLGKLQIDQQQKLDELGTAVNGPMVIRTAELQVTTQDFDKARSSLEEILKHHHGYVGQMTVAGQTGGARSLTGTLRLPASQLDATLAELKSLGRTEREAQGGEEVTQQYVDLEARLANAKNTEQRLTDILRQRTGKLSDVLAVETEISRVRGEIEEMEAQRKTMKNQVDFATLTITLAEQYKAELKAVPPSTGDRLRNAAVEGYKSLVSEIIAILLWLLSAGPTLLLWLAILFIPARLVWKKLRPRLRAGTVAG